MHNTSRTRLALFLLIAYGVTALMALPMFVGYREGLDLYAFPSAQMLYPAAGVIVGLLVTARDRKALPRGFFIAVLATAAVSVLLAFLSVNVTIPDINIAGKTFPVFTLASSYVLQAGSIAAWIALLAAGKQRRAAAGLTRRNWGMSAAMVVLFVVLCLLRTVVSLLLSGALDGSGGAHLRDWLTIFTRKEILATIAALPINYFMVFIAFFGEEYGWRYYFQPLLQRRFGPRWGVILLGVVWGLWHLPIDFMYYTQTTPVEMAISQQVACITLGIFFAYAYYKTHNIWVPVALHFLNNNIAAIFSGNVSANALQDQSISWASVLFSLLINGILLGLFLLSPVFKKAPPEEDLPALEEAPEEITQP